MSAKDIDSIAQTSNPYVPSRRATMPFELLPAGMDDVPAIVGVFQAAFQGDPIVGRLMCDVEPKIKHDYDVRFFEKYIRDGAMTGSRFAKIVATDTG